jgi:hypothetical protein
LLFLILQARLKTNKIITFFWGGGEMDRCPSNWKPEVHYHIYNSLSLTPVWSQLNAVTSTYPVLLRCGLILSFHLHLRLISGLFPSGFWTKILDVFLILPNMLHSLPISTYLIWLPLYFIKSMKKKLLII